MQRFVAQYVIRYLPVLAVLGSLVFSLPHVLSRLSAPCCWPLIIGLAGWVWLLWKPFRAGFEWNFKSVLLCMLGFLLAIMDAWDGLGWLAGIAVWMAVLGLVSGARKAGRLCPSIGFGLPWLLAVGLPPQLSAWLYERVTNRVVRDTLSWSVWSGKSVWVDESSQCTLVFGDSSLDVEVLIWSPIGVCALMTIAWYAAIRKRRSLVRHLLAQVTAAIVALGLGVCTSVMLGCWGIGNSDWRLRWMIQIAILIVACVILAVTAGALARMTRAIKSQVNHENPWIHLWNRGVAGEYSETATRSNARSKPLFFGIPPIRLFFSFLESWFWAQSYRSVVQLLPIVLLLSLAAYFDQSALRLRDSSIPRLESRLQDAPAELNGSEKERTFRTLLALNPRAENIRLGYVKYLWETQQRDICRSEIQKMLKDGIAGYPPARVWIVKNSYQVGPLIPMTDAERISQLQQARSADRSNADAFGILGEIFLSHGDRIPAEQNLRSAAGLDARWMPGWFRSLSANDRNAATLRPFELYRSDLSQKLLGAPDDREVRLRLAEMELLLGNPDRALKLIQDGRLARDTAELRSMEAEALSALARAGFRQGAYLHRTAFFPQLVQALNLAPESLECLENAVIMKIRYGAEFDNPTTKKLVDYWERTSSETGTGRNELALARLLVNDHEGVVRLLTSQLPAANVYRLALVHSLVALGRNKPATDLAFLADTGNRLQRTPEEYFAAVNLSVEAGLFDLARKHSLLSHAPRLQRHLVALVDLLEFDAKMGYPGELSPQVPGWPVDANLAERLIPPLVQSVSGETVLEFHVARRLYAIRKKSDQCRTVADQAIRKLHVGSSAPDELLLMLGTSALLDEQWTDGVNWLDSAVATGRTISAELHNNLATAILRADLRPRFDEALRLSSEACRLSPEQPGFVATRAEVLAALDRTPEAIKELEDLVKRHPNHESAQRLLTTYRGRGPQDK